MRGIIKSGSVGDVSLIRPFALPNPVPVAVVKQDDERERLERRAVHLESELKERDEAIAALKQDIVRAHENGIAQGRDLGRAEAEDRQEERLAALRSAIETSEGDLKNALQTLDRLSFVVVHECLDKIFGERSVQAGLVEAILHEQLKKVDKAALVSIEVSKDDFADLAPLQSSLREAPSVALVASAEMPSGGCRIRARLGCLEVGLNQQWPPLRDLLGDLALPEAVP